MIAMRELSGTTGNALYYLHGDHLGSTSAVTCGNSACGTVGAVLTRQSYYPYGGVRQAGNLPTDITFTGQRSDTTGLMHFGARYFSPTLGRFVSADSIVPNPGNPQSLNRYSYVLNSPLKYTDPTGHRECGEDGNCTRHYKPCTCLAFSLLECQT
jgi:RHS repeat-associated protein